PLSPVVDALRETGADAEAADALFGAIEALRIPVEYLAELFTAGDPEPVVGVLRKLAAMRSYMRDLTLDREPREELAASVGMTGEQIRAMYRLPALAPYDERYVIPTAHAEQAQALEELASGCSLDVEGGPGMGGTGPFGEGSGRRERLAVESFHALKQRQTGDTVASPENKRERVNPLNWDGKGLPPGLFPPRRKKKS